MIHFECPKCRQVFAAPDEMGGDPAQCAQCGERLLIPLASTIAPPANLSSTQTLAPTDKTVRTEKVPPKMKTVMKGSGKVKLPKQNGPNLMPWVIGGIILIVLAVGGVLLMNAAKESDTREEAARIAERERVNAEAKAEREAKIAQAKRDAEEAELAQKAKAEAKKKAQKALPLDLNPETDRLALIARKAQKEVLASLENPPPCILKPEHKIFLTRADLFPLLMTPDYQVLAAGCVSDTSRAAVFADSTLPLTSEQDPDPLLNGVLTWLAKKQGAVVAVNGNVKLRRDLEAKLGESFKFTDVAAGLANTDQYDVLVLSGCARLSDYDLEKSLPAFLNAGKGIVATPDVFTSAKGEAFLQNLGISVVKLKKNVEEVRFESNISMDLNSIVALEQLKKMVKGTFNPTQNEEKFMASALIRTLQDVPPEAKAVLKAYKDVTDRLEPLRKPVKDHIGMWGGKPFTLPEKVKIACIDAEMRALPMDKQKPHPASEFYPGVVNRKALRENANIRLNLANPYLNSTGYYAPPGEPVEIEIPDNVIGMGLKAVVGINLNDLAPEDDWYRAGSICRTFDLKEETTAVVNPYGGPIYIAVPDKDGFTYPPPSAMANASNQTPKPKMTGVTLRGAVRMGRYVIGQNTPGDWDGLVTLYENRKLPPILEIECPAVILTLPSKQALENVDRPEITATIWEDVLDECKIFTGRDFYAPFPIRLTTDGLPDSHYSSYPISICYDQTKRLVDRFEAKRHPSNEVISAMIYFFLGRASELPGKSEVMRWIFSAYLIECSSTSHRRDVHPELSLKRQTEMCHEILNTPYRWNTASAFGKMIPYMQLVDEFGWAEITDVVAEYSKISDDKWPKTDEKLNFDFGVRLSKRANQNLIPFLKIWGWRMPDRKEPKSIRNMPVWMPESFPDSYLIIK